MYVHESIYFIFFLSRQQQSAHCIVTLANNFGKTLHDNKLSGFFSLFYKKKGSKYSSIHFHLEREVLVFANANVYDVEIQRRILSVYRLTIFV